MQTARDLHVSLDHTFETFIRRRGTQQALEACQKYNGFEAQPLLLVYGPPGNGKSHLIEAVSINLCRRDIFAKVIDWAWFCRNLKDGMENHRYNQMLESLIKSRWLLLDDVGTGTTDTPWSWSVLEEIVTERYKQCDQGHIRPTMVVTNRDLKDLPPRVLSRFQDSALAVIAFNEATNYRPERKVRG